MESSNNETGESLLASLTPEVRAAVERLIEERANQLFTKMKEEFLATQTASKPLGTLKANDGSKTARVPPTNNGKKPTPPVNGVKAGTSVQRSSSKESNRSKASNASGVAATTAEDKRKELLDARKKEEDRKREEAKAKREEIERKKKEEQKLREDAKKPKPTPPAKNS